MRKRCDCHAVLPRSLLHESLYTWGFLVQSWCMRCAMWGIYSKCLSEAIVCISAMNVQDTALSMCT